MNRVVRKSKKWLPSRNLILATLCGIGSPYFIPSPQSTRQTVAPCGMYWTKTEMLLFRAKCHLQISPEFVLIIDSVSSGILGIIRVRTNLHHKSTRSEANKLFSCGSRRNLRYAYCATKSREMSCLKSASSFGLRVND